MSKFESLLQSPEIQRKDEVCSVPAVPLSHCGSASHLLSMSLSSAQSLSHVQLFATPWTAACQASLSVTNSWRLLKLLSIESVMPSNYLVLCCPLLLPPSIFPSIGLFSNESVQSIQKLETEFLGVLN